MRNSINGSIAVAVLAIAFSADAFLPDTMPVFAGQAFAANANSNGNANGKSNNGDGGRSADARSRSGDASSSGGPASGRGQGGGLRRLLTGSARPLSTATAGVATGAPLQLLPPQASGGAGSPVTAYVKKTVEPGQAPGEIHRLLGAGHSYFNSSEQAKLHASPNSRIKRVERYLDANAAAQTALAENGGVVPLEPDYLIAVAVIADPTAPPEAKLAAQVIVDAYEAFTAEAFTAEAIAARVALFEEADNRPYDAERRAVYDALAVEYPL